jgi:hypothetical protein
MVEVTVKPDVWIIITALSGAVTAIAAVVIPLTAYFAWARARYFTHRPILEIITIASHQKSMTIRNAGGRAAKIVSSIATDEGVNYPDMVSKGTVLRPNDMTALKFTRVTGQLGWTFKLEYCEVDEDAARYTLVFTADW